MSNEQLYHYVRNFINKLAKDEEKRLRFSGMEIDFRNQRDGALKALDMLLARIPVEPTPDPPQQEPLVAVPMPELDREFSLKVDQLDKHIDKANERGDFARATALRDRKAKLLRSLPQ